MQYQSAHAKYQSEVKAGCLPFYMSKSCEVFDLCLLVNYTFVSLYGHELEIQMIGVIWLRDS